MLVVLAFRSGRKSYCILVALWEPCLGFAYEIYEALTIFSSYNKASTSHIWSVSSKHAKSNRRTEKAGAILGLAIFHLWCPSWGMRNFGNYCKRKKTFSTFTLHIIHIVFPQKFCISTVFKFSWEDCKSREKLEIKLMQNIWGVNKVYYGNVKVVTNIWHRICQNRSCFDKLWKFF